MTVLMHLYNMYQQGIEDPEQAVFVFAVALAADFLTFSGGLYLGFRSGNK